MTGSVRSVQAGESGATPQDAEALLDEHTSDPPSTIVRRWNSALLGCTVLSRVTPHKVFQLA
jgi:hypothetical protein